MKKLLLVFVAFMMSAPIMAAEADRKAQCEAWAAEDGLKDSEAKEYIEYCMEEDKNSVAPEEVVQGSN
jgi:hypothetical protein